MVKITSTKIDNDLVVAVASHRNISTVNSSIEGRIPMVASMKIDVMNLLETAVSLWTISAVDPIKIVDLITIITATSIIGGMKEKAGEIHAGTPEKVVICQIVLLVIASLTEIAMTSLIIPTGREVYF